MLTAFLIVRSLFTKISLHLFGDQTMDDELITTKEAAELTTIAFLFALLRWLEPNQRQFARRNLYRVGCAFRENAKG